MTPSTLASEGRGREAGSNQGLTFVLQFHCQEFTLKSSSNRCLKALRSTMLFTYYLEQEQERRKDPVKAKKPVAKDQCVRSHFRETSGTDVSVETQVDE